MKILQFIDAIAPGGKERRMIELVKYLFTHQCAEVEIAVMSRHVKYTEIIQIGVPMHYLIRRSRKDPRILLQLSGVCRKFRPDVVHVWDTMTAVYAVPVARMHGFKLVNGMITDAPDHLRVGCKAWLRSKLTFPFSDVIVSNSVAGLRSYRVPEAKGVCIHNGFDWSRGANLIKPEVIRERFALKTPKLVGMVGEFADRKDYETFLRAAQQILSTRTDVTFVAIGDGPDFERCKSLVATPHREKILFPGWQHDVESIVNLFDVGVLATFTEGLSNSILEYMALGKPVVATDGGGTSEIVENGKTGILVSQRNVGELVRAIQLFLDDPDEARAMGQRGQDRVRTSFNIDTMVGRYVDLYRALIDRSFPQNYSR